MLCPNEFWIQKIMATELSNKFVIGSRINLINFLLFS